MAAANTSDQQEPERDLYLSIIDYVLTDPDERQLVQLIALVLEATTPEQKLSRWIRDAL